MPRSRTCQWKAAWNSEPVVGLDAHDLEGQLLEDVVDELDRALLAEPVVEAKNADARAVVDRGELVVPLACALQGGDELHVNLDLVAGLGLLVALPALGVAPIALGARQPAETQTPQDPPDPRLAEGEVVVALQIHRDLQGPEVVALAQVDDLPDDVLTRRTGAAERSRRAVAKTSGAELLVATAPFVEALASDAVVAAGPRDVLGDLLRVTQDSQAVGRGLRELSFGQLDLPLLWKLQ